MNRSYKYKMNRSKFIGFGDNVVVTKGLYFGCTGKVVGIAERTGQVIIDDGRVQFNVYRHQMELQRPQLVRCAAGN